MSIHAQSATPNGTRSYFERLKNKGLAVRFATLGATDLRVSRIGFGSYRIHEFDSEHRDALKLAVLNGCNLIDTSANYMDGSSERVIGEVMNELFVSGEVKREEIVFVTKAGYVQGENMKLAKERIKSRNPFPEMVEYQADCWHNLSPEFLEDQITRSLERLKLTTLDVLLLHNPEYCLKAGGNRDTYYQRIEKAFRHLEAEREKGRIRFYGISSNTFPEPESRSDFTSLARVHDIATGIHKNHRFAVVQLPFNLFESGGALIRNNRQESVFEFAARHKIGVLTNRPFNALQRGRLVRLTSFPKHDEVEVKGGLHTLLGRAIELEKRAPGSPRAPQGLQWAHALRDKIADIDDLLGWKDALYQQIFPSIRQALSRLSTEHQAWADDYQNTMQQLLTLVTADLEGLANQKSQIVSEQIRQYAPGLETSSTLAQQMVRLYTSLPQLTSVLVGMRKVSYVQDVMAAGPSLSEEEALQTLDRMQRHKS